MKNVKLRDIEEIYNHHVIANVLEIRVGSTTAGLKAREALGELEEEFYTIRGEMIFCIILGSVMMEKLYAHQ